MFQLLEMDPTDNQDELMHDLIRDSTAYVAPEFDEDENDGSQLLYLGFLDIFFFLPTNILVLVAMIMQV